MKPKNKIQSRLVELSGQLSPLTTPQMEWAFRNTHEHFAYRLKGGKSTCMDCGAEFIETRDGRCFCPECGTQLEIKDTKERVIKQKSYFVVITTKEEYQVVRMWMLLSEMRKGAKAKPAYLEIGQYWINPQGRKTVIGLQRTLGGYYFDTFSFCSPFEIRRDNEAFWRIADEWVYPRIKVTDTIKRNGFKGSCHHIHPVSLFQQLLSNPKAETLMKSNEIELLRYLCHHPEDVDKYWNTIKIAKRNGYKFKDVGMWFDYIKMLEQMGRDINSPTLIAPKDLKTAHDIYVAKVNRQRIKEQREKERQQAIKDKAKFEELKSRYFGMAMTDGEIEIHSIDTIDDYYKIGESQSICCGTAKYFLKESTLTLTAYIGNKQIATIEISLDDYHIIQCRAFANGICEYTEQIAGIINANKKMIAERKRA
ncbi:PcfJ domain-containing protein [uncultured Duncaniella sp.]|jgi:Zn finger protein HypA/HybF involved in hydrogenase expression|uniref:PcfJ domain-containing protein n=1 Tax=uncultured Duncaniella sp. TaxID=2768039 RepID=UPI002602C15E|nr:PcfJ domain-containing protein [uncultured Duncaniella sp.]